MIDIHTRTAIIDSSKWPPSGTVQRADREDHHNYAPPMDRLAPSQSLPRPLNRLRGTPTVDIALSIPAR
jgi:hypothetical protein